MAIEYVPLTVKQRGEVAAVERDAYQLHTGLYDEYAELRTLLGQRAADRYSFLLKDGDCQSYCIAALQNSYVRQDEDATTLYISDFAVRTDAQRSYYGLLTAQELLRRASADDVLRIEFHARGSTSYGAINASKHTGGLLSRYNYRLDEISASDIYASNGRWEESLHLISLEKIATNHL